MKLRRRVRQAIDDVRTNRKVQAKLARILEVLTERLERDQYPSFQTEAFRNDDLIERARTAELLETCAAKEQELVQQVRYWLERRRIGR